MAIVLDQKSVKQKVELVILESYRKVREKNFKDLNFLVPKGESVISFLKSKIKIFHNLDEYSATFLSIHTRAKITLREFKDDAFEGNYLELLRLILTLPEELANGRKKSIKVEQIHESEFKNIDKFIVGPSLVKENVKLKPNTKIVELGINGKKLEKEKKMLEIEEDDMSDIVFEDEEEELELPEDDLSDINLT